MDGLVPAPPALPWSHSHAAATPAHACPTAHAGHVAGLDGG